jgi:nucleoside-diphosphate-sugar epimerase
VKDVIGDVGEQRTWKAALPGVDIVFHLAAQTSASVAEADPAADFMHNVLPMDRLLHECRRRRPAIIFASTATVVGIPLQLPVDESGPDHPITVYDQHKKAAEDLLAPYPLGVSLRLSNVYGPGPLSTHPDRGVLNAMIARALAGAALTIFGSGERVRDYLFVEDAAKAFLAAARCAGRIGGRHFVVGTGRGHTIAEAIRLVASRVAARTGVAVAVRHANPPGGLVAIDARDFVANSREFRSATRWRPLVSLADGIDRTINGDTK